jgi:hypothetical protein
MDVLEYSSIQAEQKGYLVSAEKQFIRLQSTKIVFAMHFVVV